jgi:parallel beta-helix repeat protein
MNQVTPNPLPAMIRILSLILLFSSATAVAQSAIVDVSDYATIHEAAAALPQAGGTLKLPPGEYKIDKPIRITTGDTRIEGSGAASHIINENKDGQPAILIQNPKFAGKSTPNKERLWRVNLANFRVTGNEASGAGIEAHYIEEIFVQGVTSSYHGGDGLHLHFCYEDPRINDCLFTYNKKCGVYLEGCHDIVVSANQFEENQDGLQCIDSFNLTMSGNNLDDHLGNGVVIENTYGSVVAGNMIEECQGWAIVLDRDCYGITLSANVIAHEFSGGIDLRDAHGCAVSANTFTIVKKVGLAVRKDSGSITISANNFSDSRIGTADDSSAITKRGTEPTGSETNPNEATGILLEGCQAVVISGNLFSGLTGESVRKSGDCRKILLNGNGEQSGQ